MKDRSNVNSLLWVKLPLSVRRLSTGLPHVLLDGMFLNAWPPAGRLAPPLCLLIGLLTGWLQLGYRTVFSESLVLTMLMVGLGVFSAHLGFMLLLGFIVGDFFLAHSMLDSGIYRREGFLEYVLRNRIPLLIQYGVLAFALTKIALTTKLLIGELKLGMLSLKAKFAIAFVLHALLTGVLVYFWTQAVPLLIRPVFVWAGLIPTVAAMRGLQDQELVVVAVAVLASMARMGLQGLTVFREPLSTKLDALQQLLLNANPVRPWTEQLSPWLLIGWTAATTTLLLSGALQTIVEGVLLFGWIGLILAVRKGMLPLPLERWYKLMRRIPLLFRLIVGFVAVKILSDPILDGMLRQTDTFRPVLYLTAVSMVVLLLLVPGIPLRKGGAREQEPSH
jgi:hypothetical protein